MPVGLNLTRRFSTPEVIAEADLPQAEKPLVNIEMLQMRSSKVQQRLLGDLLDICPSDDRLFSRFDIEANSVAGSVESWLDDDDLESNIPNRPDESAVDYDNKNWFMLMERLNSMLVIDGVDPSKVAQTLFTPASD